VEVTDQGCLEATVPGQPCYRIATYLDTYLKDDALILRLISLITDILIEGTEDPLLGRFALPSVVVNAEVVGLSNLTPTMAPSSLPSYVPSISPSSSSENPTARPSETPSYMPSNPPSLQPSAQPSSSPTFEDLSNFFSEVIDVVPVEGDDEVIYAINCDGDNGDVVILARGVTRDSVDCLGHVRRRDYLDGCNADVDPFTVTLEIALDDYDAYEEVLVGYMLNEEVAGVGCNRNSLNLGTLAPSTSPSVRSAPPSLVPSASPSVSSAPSTAPSPYPSLASASPSTAPSLSLAPSSTPTNV
jgi:hypothetical protein